MSQSDRRFSRVEITVHGVFALLVFIAIASAALLWFDPLAVWFGRRELATRIHTITGLLLPVPLALGLLSASFRSDARKLERLSSNDKQWLRSKDRRSGSIPVDRFNAGQKLNAAFTVGAITVLFGTGLIMGSILWSWPTKYRTGATWVHDWTAFAVTVAVVGHVYYALRYQRGDYSTAAADVQLTPP
ncbi:MAG TPA: cytochrome b/b6 domain-containing protein [Actinomycetes bacterium]|nr:cytochrome b/b6 domain-containing protein [Actinomycetes bacterium]